MEFLVESESMDKYLSSSDVIDYDAGNVAELASKLAQLADSEIDLARNVYEYVRDEIKHSWDIMADSITCNASDVLVQGHGNCCGKSHLLAAILRSLNIPTGFCYQWLKSNDFENRLSLHGFNAIYLKEIHRWIRVDARGNIPGIDAQFSLAEEQLAWTANPEWGEIDDPVIYMAPKADVVRALRASRNLQQVKANWLYQPIKS